MMKDTNYIISEIRKKNQLVFRELFDLLYKRLVLYADSYLADLEQSEDIVQDAFLYLWENAQDIDIKRSLKSYMFSMVRNHCLRVLKKRNITDNLEFMKYYATVRSEYEMVSEEEKEDGKKRYSLVLKAIETFPPQMKEIFKLRFFENYKYHEIAEILGVSIGTVKKQISRARADINKFMGMVISFL